MLGLRARRHYPAGRACKEEPQHDKACDEILPQHVTGHDDRLVELLDRLYDLALLVAEVNIGPEDTSKYERVAEARWIHEGLALVAPLNCLSDFILCRLTLLVRHPGAITTARSLQRVGVVLHQW